MPRRSSARHHHSHRSTACRPRPARRRIRAAVVGGLHPRPCRAAAAARSHRVLGRGRHAGGHGGVDASRPPPILPSARTCSRGSSPGRPRCNSATRTASPSCARRIDRISGRQLIDQEQYEQKLEQILRRQSALEARAERAERRRRGHRLDQAAGARGEPRLIRSSRRCSTTRAPSSCRSIAARRSIRAPASSPRARAASAARSPACRRRSTGSSSARARRSIRWRRPTIPRRGASAACLPISASISARSRAPRAGRHGRPVRSRRPAQGGAGIRAAAASHQVGARHGRSAHAHAIGSIPVRKPVDGDIDPASGIRRPHGPVHELAGDAYRARSARRDRRSGARHRGRQGDDRRAGAAATAGWSTSTTATACPPATATSPSIDVRVGQSIRTGQIIGKIGSTGRSTGPHLHYETRVRGGAVDPQKFLRAGQKLDANL